MGGIGALIQPLYFKGKRGRPPRGIETMLRMYPVQAWFNLSDEGVEDAIYDSYALRKFMGMNILTEQVPDATTLLTFRYLPEERNLRIRPAISCMAAGSWVRPLSTFPASAGREQSGACHVRGNQSVHG